MQRRPKVWTRGAFDAGRNMEKRLAREDQRIRRIAQVAEPGHKYPKRKLGQFMTDLYADRRLRQRLQSNF